MMVTILDMTLQFDGFINDDEKFGGCKSWWVIGYIIGNDVDELGLEEYDKLIGDHLDGCPQKTWQHNECTCGFKN